MSSFFDFLKVIVTCGTVFFVVMLLLLALPKSRLRSLGLECLKYVLAAGLILMVPNPIDVLPDVVGPVGWLDDLAYVGGGIAAFRSALKDRRQRAFEQQCENAMLARMASHPPSNAAAGVIEDAGAQSN